MIITSISVWFCLSISTPAYKRDENSDLWSQWLACANEEALIGWVQLACDQLVQACSSDVGRVGVMVVMLMLMLMLMLIL